MSSQPSIHYLSQAVVSGYGVAARRLVRALDGVGAKLRWTPTPEGGVLPTTVPDGFGREFDRLISAGVRHDVTCFHDLPEHITMLTRDDRPWIAHTVWEADRMPSHWPPILNSFAGVLVPCRWNADVFAMDGVTVPIGVVPHVADLFDETAGGWAGDEGRFDSRDVLDSLGVPDDTFVVTTIGHWNARKDPGLAVRAFLRAFTADDPVVLVVKTAPQTWLGDLETPGIRAGTADWELAHIVSKFARPAQVVLVTEFWPEYAIRALHRATDCYLTLSHGEGWGLGAFDAATLGVPVVTPGYGGLLDYLDPSDAYFVDHALVRPRFSVAYSYEAHQRWAEPDIEHAAYLLRYVFDHRDEASRRGARAAQRIARDFAPSVVAAQFLDFAASFVG